MVQSVYDYQNQVLGSKEHFSNGLYVNDLEGFSYINEDVILRTILFSMLYYIISSKVVYHILSKSIRNLIDIQLLQTFIFAIFFYLISIHL
jgi:hypothetical protein